MLLLQNYHNLRSTAEISELVATRAESDKSCLVDF